MQLNGQPKAVIHLFSSIDGKGRYDRKELPSGRVQLLFNSAQIGGWVDDSKWSRIGTCLRTNTLSP